MKRCLVVLLLFFLIIWYPTNKDVPTDGFHGTHKMAAVGDWLHSLVFGSGPSASVSQNPYPQAPAGLTPASGQAYQAAPGLTGYTGASNPTTPAAGVVSFPAPQSVLGDSTTNTTGAGGGAAAPVDPLAQYKTPVMDKIKQIQDAYNLLNGNVDKQIQDQTSLYNQQYDTQAKQLNDAFSNQQGQLGGAYAARGLGQSSFLGDAQGQAANIYNTNNDALTQSRTATLAGLGRTGAQQHATNASALQQYQDMLNNLGQYDQAEAASKGAGQVGLQNLNNTLGQNLGAVQTQNAGLGTNADFVNKLQSFAPQANQGTNQLASQLQSLVTSGAPQFAKSQIAQGLIKQSQLQDPNAQGYWQNYFQQLLNGQG